METHPLFIGSGAKGVRVELDTIAAGVLSPLGYDVLEASIKSSGHQKRVLVRIERKDEAPVTVADLQRASYALGHELERLDLIEGRYLLEVESPGSERPLLSARHFERFRGLKVKVRSPEGNFTGRVQMVREGEVDFLLEKDETRTLKLGTFKANLAEWPETPR